VWSSAAETAVVNGRRAAAPVAVSSLGAPAEEAVRFSSGSAEVDRVLGGGLVSGAVLLLAGEPGIGKSTLVLQLLDGIVAEGRRPLLVTGEESLGQVSLRAMRLGIDAARLRALASSSLEATLSAAADERPDVLVVDSIQTLHGESAEHAPGSVVQVRDCSAALIRYAKATGAVVVLVGHVTKDGSVAGPKTLEHLVDVVLALDGERTGTLRLLRSVKNRFGSCDETGVLTMGENGLEPVPDPSALLLADRREGVAGSVVFPSLEGTRPVLVELQALVAKADTPQARRVAIGLDARRVALLLGVLDGRAETSFAQQDVFSAAAGGIAVKEPAADLALCLALHSARHGRPVPDDLVAMGEIGLGGEVRRVPGVARRLAEARRFGFRRALVPRGVEDVARGIEVTTVSDLATALSYCE